MLAQRPPAPQNQASARQVLGHVAEAAVLVSDEVQLPLEMRATSARKVGLLLGWLFLMASSGITVVAGGVAYAIIGLFGLAFFGYAGIKLYRQRSDVAGLILTSEGVRPVGWNTPIPWSEITQVGVGKFSHNKLVGFNVASYDRLIA